MKKEIHPTYYPETVISCACGAVHSIGSTMETISIELCSTCHPFYTGQEKLLDTAGHVEKFKATQKKSQEVRAVRKGKKVKQAARAVKRAEKQPTTVKE